MKREKKNEINCSAASCCNYFSSRNIGKTEVKVNNVVKNAF